MAEAPDPAAVAGRLAASGVEPCELELQRLTGGASREVYLVRCVDDQRRWVLRRDPPGAPSFVPLVLEYRLLAAAAEAGVPVPAPLDYEDAGGAYGSAGFLMEHVPGESVAPRLLKKDEYAAARAALPAQLGAALARIHAIDPAAVAGVSLPESDPALAACELWERELDRIGEPLPAVEAGLRWLRLHPPPAPARPALVHGDFRLGNFIVEGDGLAAVIDWELTHGGDGAEDIGWLTIRSWRFGNDALPVAGVGALEPFLDAYREAGGTVPPAESLRWWEAMGNVKWAVICARQAKDHLDGVRPSHELASLGRRVCEPEWDLLALLGGGAGAAPGSGPGEAG
jgi:aminoglycoside phosphotransferase (APT) family kinase protein